MAQEGGFDAFMLDALRHETQLIEHEHHPSLDVLLDHLAGNLSPYEHSKITAHIATCSHCKNRLQSLSKMLEEEQVVLASKARVSDFKEFISQQNKSVSSNKQRRNVIKALLQRTTLSPVWAVSMASVTVIAIAFAVAIPFLQGPSATTSADLSALSNEIRALQGEVIALAQGEITIPADFSTLSQPTIVELQLLVDKSKEISDPWQRSLMISSFLTKHGVFVPDDLDWTDTPSYVVQPGESWETISLGALGNASLWPLLFLLNAQRDFPGGALPVGATIILPTRRE
jgi:hypothetical protein